MNRQLLHWLLLTALFIGSTMLALSVVLDSHRFLGAFRESFLMAVVINIGFGAFSGYLAGLLKFLDSRDSAELTVLFGVKIGLAVFAVLMLVSFLLKLYGQPPTAAPGMIILAPFLEPNFLLCCCDPTWIIVGDGIVRSRSKAQDRRKLEAEVKRIRAKDAKDRGQ